MLTGNTLARRFVTAAALAGIGAVCAVAIDHVRGDTPGESQRRVFSELHPTVVDSSEGKALSVVLDQIIQPPAVLGYVRGVVTGEGTAVKVGKSIFTDYPLRVTGFYGPDNPGYTNGSDISLRVPGGTADGVTAVAGDAPAVSNGMTVYVLAAGERAFTYGGGDSLTRLVAVVPGQDLFEVRGNEVHGQGTRADFHETEDVFQKHFTKK